MAPRPESPRTPTLTPERARIALEEQLRLAAEIQRKLLPAIPREAFEPRRSR